MWRRVKPRVGMLLRQLGEKTAMRLGLVAFLAVVGFAFGTHVAATVVHFNPAGNATDISLLVIDHSTYDVTFEYGLYQDLFPGLQTQFWNFSEPFLAAQAIAAAL